MKYSILLDSAGIIGGSDDVEVGQISDSTSTGTESVPVSGGFLSTPTGMIAYIIFLIALVYFFWIRPSRKKEKELSKMRDEIKLGDSVLLDSGIYGKVAGISGSVYTIELGTNKSVLVHVLKNRVVAKAEPNLNEEEEKK